LSILLKEFERKESAPAAVPDGVAKPGWLKVRLPAHPHFFQLRDLLQDYKLNTICQSARCPNMADCWSARTATFLLLGKTCTRRCAFCAVAKGKPEPPSPDEPQRVADAVAALDLDYAVLTSVTRDDLADGGAGHFAATVRAIKARSPGIKVEVLIPDLRGNKKALRTVIESGPDVLNHNLETTESCYPLINRPVEHYRRSLDLLTEASLMGSTTKSGLMVGLGEDEAQLLRTMEDLVKAGCRLLTIGQYLRPSKNHVPVRKYYHPDEFDRFSKIGMELGFRLVEAGPLVRSSYRAARMYDTLARDQAEQDAVSGLR